MSTQPTISIRKHFDRERAHRLRPGFVETVVTNVSGDEMAVGDEVALADEFSSLAEHKTFGTIRSIEAYGDSMTNQFKVGVLWYGFGGLWIRHYTPDQLVPVHAAIRGESEWEVVGGEDDSAEREAVQRLIRATIEEGGVQVLGVSDEKRQAIIEELLLALPDATEQDVRDVISDMRWEDEVAQKQKRAAFLGHFVAAYLEPRFPIPDTEARRHDLLTGVLAELEKVEGQIIFSDEQCMERHIARQLRAQSDEARRSGLDVEAIQSAVNAAVAEAHDNLPDTKANRQALTETVMGRMEGRAIRADVRTMIDEALDGKPVG